MDCSTPGLPVHHQLLELAQTYVHLLSDAIQPSHPLSSPPSPAFNLSQHQVFSSESVLCIRWQCRRPGFNPPVRKIPCRRERQTTPVFLPGEFHGQRSPVGYSPWGCGESDTTKWLTLSFSSMSSPSTQCNSPSEQCWSELWVQNKESPGRHRINKILPSYGGLPLFNWENDIWSLLCSDYSMKNESHETWISRAWRFYSYEESHILNA